MKQWKERMSDPQQFWIVRDCSECGVRQTLRASSPRDTVTHIDFFDGDGKPSVAHGYRKDTPDAKSMLDVAIDAYWHCHKHNLDSRTPQDHRMHEDPCTHFPLDKDYLEKVRDYAGSSVSPDGVTLRQLLAHLDWIKQYIESLPRHPVGRETVLLRQSVIDILNGKGP